MRPRLSPPVNGGWTAHVRLSAQPACAGRSRNAEAALRGHQVFAAKCQSCHVGGSNTDNNSGVPHRRAETGMDETYAARIGPHLRKAGEFSVLESMLNASSSPRTSKFGVASHSVWLLRIDLFRVCRPPRRKFSKNSSPRNFRAGREHSRRSFTSKSSV